MALPLGHPARHLGTVASTMDEAAAWATNGAPHGALVTARAQTAGRGRHGRTWHDAPDASLLLTLVLRPEALALPAERLPLVPLAAGLALADVARTFGADASVKWPNDVVVAHGGTWRKLAGVLAEARHTGGALAVLLGVGLNVGQTTFPPDVAGRATSLALATGRALDRLAPLAPFLARLAETLAQAASDPASLVAAVEARLAGVGGPVAVAFPGTDRPPVHGTLRGLAPDGALVIGTSDGDAVVHAGEATLAPSREVPA